MLVLSRKCGETIMIGRDITVTVLEVHRGRVKLGLAGPPAVPIRRKELASGSEDSSRAVDHRRLGVEACADKKPFAGRRDCKGF